MIEQYIEMMNSFKIQIRAPSSWDEKYYPYAEIQVHHLTDEFEEIKNKFLFVINKVIRIQNYSAFEVYTHEKRFLEKMNKSNKIKEELLYYGSGNIDPSLIYSE